MRIIVLNDGRQPRRPGVFHLDLPSPSRREAADKGARTPGTLRMWHKSYLRSTPSGVAGRRSWRPLFAVTRRECESSGRSPEAMPDRPLTSDLLVDFEAEASLLDQVGLIQDLEALLGMPVDVISAGGLRPRHHRIREEAIDL